MYSIKRHGKRRGSASSTLLLTFALAGAAVFYGISAKAAPADEFLKLRLCTVWAGNCQPYTINVGQIVQMCENIGSARWELSNEKSSVLRCLGRDQLSKQPIDLGFQFEPYTGSTGNFAAVTRISANGQIMSNADAGNLVSNLDADFSQQNRRAEEKRKGEEQARQIEALPKEEVVTPPNTANMRGFFVGMEAKLMYQQLRFLNARCPPPGHQGSRGFGPCIVPGFGEFNFDLSKNLQPQQVMRFWASFESAEDRRIVVKKIEDHFGVRSPDPDSWDAPFSLSNGVNAELKRPLSGTTWTVYMGSNQLWKADASAKDATKRSAAPTPKF